MTFATLMVHVDLEQPNEACLRIAVDLAQQFSAKLVGIAAADLQPVCTERGAAARKIVDWQRAELETQLARAEERFRYAVADRVSETEWRSAVALPEDYVVRAARAADLVVTAAKDVGATTDPVARLDPGALVMRAGRPVLIVPPDTESLELNCAIVAWKDTREARRAVSDALPLLRKMREVVVAEVVRDETERAAARGRIDDVAAWLLRHGIAAVSRVFHFPEKKEPVEQFWAYGANLLVAGAYGRAPWREWMFGGFTEAVLRHPRQCAFLAH